MDSFSDVAYLAAELKRRHDAGQSGGYSTVKVTQLAAFTGRCPEGRADRRGNRRHDGSAPYGRSADLRLGGKRVTELANGYGRWRFFYNAHAAGALRGNRR